MVVTGYDDRQGCGFVLSTGSDAASAHPGGQQVSHDGVTIVATPELANSLREALLNKRPVLLAAGGPQIPLTLDDRTVLAWLTNHVGGVLTVRGAPPGPDPRLHRRS